MQILTESHKQGSNDSRDEDKELRISISEEGEGVPALVENVEEEREKIWYCDENVSNNVVVTRWKANEDDCGHFLNNQEEKSTCTLDKLLEFPVGKTTPRAWWSTSLNYGENDERDEENEGDWPNNHEVLCETVIFYKIDRLVACAMSEIDCILFDREGDVWKNHEIRKGLKEKADFWDPVDLH